MKIMFVSGVGFFTDADDLFVIGIVVYLLTSQWNLSTGQVSLLNSITLAASAVGALVPGWWPASPGASASTAAGS
jgi:MFS family permease